PSSGSAAGPDWKPRRRGPGRRSASRSDGHVIFCRGWSGHAPVLPLLQRAFGRPEEKMIFLLLFLLVLPVCAEELSENQARFGVITGDVGLLSQGASEWIEPHEGLPLEPGDHIRTGEDARVEILPGPNALWVLEPESEMGVEHMEANAGRFNLSSGTL